MMFLIAMGVIVPILFVAECEVATAVVILVASVYGLVRLFASILEAYEQQYGERR